MERPNLHLISGLGMARAVIRGFLTAQALVHLVTSPCEIGIGRSGTGTLFSAFTLVFPLLVSLHKCCTLIRSSVTDCYLSTSQTLLNKALKKLCFFAPRIVNIYTL